MSNRICKSCDFVNEDVTRIFCENCGVRLEPVQETQEKKEKKAEPVRSAVLPQTTQQKEAFDIGAFFFRNFFRLLRIAFLAALTAVIILFFSKPEVVPPPLTEPPENLDASRRQILEFSSSDFPRVFNSSIPLAQALLEKEFDLTTSDTPLAFIRATPQRLYIVPANNQLTLGLEMSVLGFPVYVASDYTSEEGKLQFVSSRIGRLDLPKMLQPYWDWTTPLLEANSPLYAAVEKSYYVGITPEEITLRWRGLNKNTQNTPQPATEETPPNN
ncbi:MAG: hypothetical protein ACK5NG_09735 [Chthoniobacterales bacterium]